MSHLLAIFKFCVVFFPVLFTIPIIPPYAPMCGNFSQIEILKLYKNDPILDVLVMAAVEDRLKLQNSPFKLKLNWVA